jgi:hypothetical protein
MAIEFFNGCAKFSDEIAFIVPRTFRKDSVQNRLDLNFHMKSEWLLPEKSFLVMDPTSESLTSEYDVPCVFQIWEKKNQKRTKVVASTESKYLNFVDNIKKAKYAFRRVGVQAGELYNTSNNSRSMAPQSHYYINCKQHVADTIRSLKWDYNSSKYDTAGNPSISKSELIKTLEKALDKK